MHVSPYHTLYLNALAAETKTVNSCFLVLPNEIESLMSPRFPKPCNNRKASLFMYELTPEAYWLITCLNLKRTHKSTRVPSPSYLIHCWAFFFFTLSLSCLPCALTAFFFLSQSDLVDLCGKSKLEASVVQFLFLCVFVWLLMKHIHYFK